MPTPEQILAVINFLIEQYNEQTALGEIKSDWETVVLPGAEKLRKEGHEENEN